MEIISVDLHVMQYQLERLDHIRQVYEFNTGVAFTREEMLQYCINEVSQSKIDESLAIVEACLENQAEMKSISDQIKVGRKVRGYSQAELADAIGIKQSSISYWEKGVKKPIDKHIKRLEEVLNIQITLIK